MLLYHAALFHANRKPPTSATIDGSLRKDFRINFNFDSESTKTNFAITTATQSPFVFDYGARAPRRHVSSHSQQWIGSCHSITRRCRRGYFEYEKSNISIRPTTLLFYHVGIIHASKKRRAINTTLSETLSSHGRRAHGKMPPGTAGSKLNGVHT